MKVSMNFVPNLRIHFQNYKLFKCVKKFFLIITCDKNFVLMKLYSFNIFFIMSIEKFDKEHMSVIM